MLHCPKTVARKIDAEQAEGAQRQAVQGAVENVVILALVRFFPGRRRRHAVVFSKVSHAEDPDENHRNGDQQIQRIAVFPPDKANQEGLRENADRKRQPVAKQSFHERNVDVDRDLVLFSQIQRLNPNPWDPSSATSALRKI